METLLTLKEYREPLVLEKFKPCISKYVFVKDAKYLQYMKWIMEIKKVKMI